MQQKLYNCFRLNPSLRILFVFDEDGLIEEDMNDEVWEEGYHYEVFDGLPFNTKYRLEHELQDKKVILLFRQKNPLPCNTPTLDFPLLDLLVANQVFSNDDCDQFMQEHHINVTYRDYVKKNLAKLQTKKIWDILKPYTDNGGFTSDMANRAMISSELGTSSLLEWNNIIIRMIMLSAEGCEEKKAKFYSTLQNAIYSEPSKAVKKKLIEIFGIDPDFSDDEPLKRVAMKWKHSIITCGLELNKIDNRGLRINLDADIYDADGLRIKDTNKLKLINVIQEASENLNEKDSQLFNNAFNTLSSQIEEKQIIRAYGIDASYAYITDKLCWYILNDVFTEKIGSDFSAARRRVDEISGKRSYKGALSNAIRYAQTVISFYLKANQLGTSKLNTPNEYIDKYINDLSYVDRFYRLSLESFKYISSADCPIYSQIVSVKNKLEENYKEIEHRFNYEWVKCLKEVGRDISSVILPKQNELFNQWVNNNNKQVVIVSDALRYEVADELVGELATLRHKASLSAALAMLPTETKYCKPALLPHTSLKLSLDGTPDLQVDGNVLGTTDKRKAQLLKYSPYATLIDYKEYINMKSSLSREKMRDFFKPYQVIYIMHDTIDHAGHDGDVVSACRQAINELRQLVSELHSTYNISYVTITSDHGFLYREMEFKGYDKQRTEEIKEAIENKSRYYLTKEKGETSGFTKFRLTDVSNIANEDIYVAVPNGSNRIYAPGDDYHFAHGGASLQEMIIPIILSHKEHDNTKTPVNFSILKPLEVVSSCLKFNIFQNEAVDSSHQSRSIKIGLFDGSNPVSELKTLTLDSTDAIEVNNRRFQLELMLNKHDAGSVLKLKIFDQNDVINPLEEHNVINNTLVDMDF